MEYEVSKKKINWEKVALISLIVVGAVLFLILLFSLFGGKGTRGIQQKTTSDLISTDEIAVLSVSEFVYNGIAQAAKEDGDPDYNALYKSTVKVSVGADSIDFSVDDEQKTVTFRFSDFEIESPVIDVGSISLIPNRNDLYMDEVIKLCRDDALKEAKQSTKLISSAKENLVSIIEAWYSSVFEGYSFDFQFADEEGGVNK